MTGEAQLSWLADGRLHLHHGPIDLIIEAWGEAPEVSAAYRQAADRFQDVLETLVQELDILRTAVGETVPDVQGPVARRMADAVWPFCSVYITPMAAVAGAVADEILAAMVKDRMLSKAYVNNGGDIAFHLAAGESLKTALIGNVEDPVLDAIAVMKAEMPVRGLATSGWRGRSFSLGIADSVTVFARCAALADAAATMVANAVCAEHSAIERKPACQLRDDTDLGALAVTISVGTLPRHVVETALRAGKSKAVELQKQGLIYAAALCLQKTWRTVLPSRSPAARKLADIVTAPAHQPAGLAT